MNNEGISFDLNTSFEIPKDIVSRKNQDNTIILMRMDESNYFYKIDGIAADVWFKMTDDKYTTLKQITEEIMQNNQHVAKDKLSTDINTFINDLVAKELLVLQ